MFPESIPMLSWPVAGRLLTIVVPFPGSDRFTPEWSASERTVDFRREPLLACRCTVAFAAAELERYLRRTVPGLAVRFAPEPPPAGFALILETVAAGSRSDVFELIPEGAERLRIRGEGRTGTLFGAYAFLKCQGWDWYAPGDAGELAPEPAGSLCVPQAPWTDRPALDAGRGFDLEYDSMDSAGLLLWAARNGFNVWAGRQGTFALACKLGMSVKAGGHIFERLLAPDAVLPGGRTIWEAHPEWFGLPEGGARNRESAQRTQFCVSQPELIAFLGEALIERLNAGWSLADRLDLWGFDTWGSTCQCPGCRGLGNPGDALLAFASKIREILDRAEAEGRLDRHVTLILCAYEGTSSLEGPSRPVPANLAADGTLVTFYPINRCYLHPLAAPECRTNRRYWNALQTWTQARPALRIVMGEYYNVSKFEDLPFLFSDVMRRDWPSYRDAGVRGATYMHIPTVHWGQRTLTQNLFARLTRAPERPAAPWIAAYFERWYGAHARLLRESYELTERAGRHSAQWRAWAEWSVLSRLLAWDGISTAQPLRLHEHFADPSAAIAAGRDALDALGKALELVETARQNEKAALARQAPVPQRAVNPAELQRYQAGTRISKRLAEDGRLLRYGIDVMELTVALLEYRGALAGQASETAAGLWRGIEALADRLEQYVVPIHYANPGPGLVLRDALERSQLGPVVRRCRR